MKKGCLLFLAVLAAAFFGYQHLLSGTELGDKIWIPALLALGAAGLIANLHGIALALKQRRAGNRPRNAWKDGEFVGVSGRLQAAAPLKAPFSGTAAALLEYSVKRTVRSNDSTSTVSDYSGFLMTPCAIQTKQGAVKLVGFPLLVNHNAANYQDEASYRRAAEYLSRCTFREQSSNPLKAIRELTEVLSDDDGTVKFDFCNKSSTAHLAAADDEPLAEGTEPVTAQPADMRRVDAIIARMRECEYTLQETIIEQGAEVTAFGTYDRTKQALNIGSGLKNLAHSLQLGSMTQVTAKALRTALISSFCWAVVVGAGNWFVLKQIGIEIPFLSTMLQQ